MKNGCAPMRSDRLSRASRAAIGALILEIIAAPVTAHHSFSAVFDADAPVTLDGIVTEVEWTNPHVWIHLDVGDGSNAVHWAVELGSTNGLIRSGWSRSTVKVGDRIRVLGYRAKDGSTRGSVRSITVADGRELRGTSARPR